MDQVSAEPLGKHAMPPALIGLLPDLLLLASVVDRSSQI